MYLRRIADDGQIRCLLTFDGRLDAARLARAVRLTLDAAPVLGCRFVERPWRPYWERCDDLDEIVFCRLVEAADPQSQLFQFMATEMDPCAGPQVQAVLFRSERDTLCLKISHLVADAGATLDYLELLAATYRQLGADPAYRPAPNLRGSRRPSQVLRFVGLRTLLRACLRFSYPRPTWNFPSSSRDCGPSFLIRRIAAESMAHIKAYSQQRQVSVNDVLLTAFYRALFVLLDPRTGLPLPVTVSTNLRRYLPSGRAGGLCNLSGGLFPATTRERGETFDETLLRVHAAMAAAKAQRAELAQMLYLEGSFLLGLAVMRHIVQQDQVPQVACYSTHPHFANLGIIAAERFNFVDATVTDVALFGPLPYPPGFVFSVATFRGMMTLTTGFCSTGDDGRTVERFFDLFVGELPP